VIRDSSEQTILLQLDARIDALASEGDFDALSALLADDFRYIHSTGLTQSKSEWIHGLGQLIGQRRRVVSNLIDDQHGDIAVVTGDLDVVWNDGRLALDRYVRVYRHEGGNWRAFFQRTFPASDRKKPDES
jgi:ketosteroid isomerase-like protein